MYPRDTTRPCLYFDHNLHGTYLVLSYMVWVLDFHVNA